MDTKIEVGDERIAELLCVELMIASAKQKKHDAFNSQVVILDYAQKNT
jgi:hypothetical protein